MWPWRSPFGIPDVLRTITPRHSQVCMIPSMSSIRIRLQCSSPTFPILSPRPKTLYLAPPAVSSKKQLGRKLGGIVLVQIDAKYFWLRSRGMRLTLVQELGAEYAASIHHPYRHGVHRDEPLRTIKPNIHCGSRRLAFWERWTLALILWSRFERPPRSARIREMWLRLAAPGLARIAAR